MQKTVFFHFLLHKYCQKRYTYSYRYSSHSFHSWYRMKIDGKHYRTIWLDDTDNTTVRIIDQRKLPHDFEIESLRTVEDAAQAIKDMHVRGAGLIGATAGFGMYLASLQASKETFDQELAKSGELLDKSRPTAKNLKWAVDRILNVSATVSSVEEKRDLIKHEAINIADEDAEFCRQIGQHGVEIIKAIATQKKGTPVNILTHCNAGWLAFVDYGSATAPIYASRDLGIDVHVWVDETRPWNQGAKLTAWELQQESIPNTLIPDNTGGHLMQNGMVDLVITGTDRTTNTGDVANKIGTYLKALAARDNNIPFYVALPSSTFDWELASGSDIPIEQRSGEEVTHITGKDKNNNITTIQLAADNTAAVNYSFDVTPSRLITGLITERGIVHAERNAILNMFPEHGTQTRGTHHMKQAEKRRFDRQDSIHLLDYIVVDNDGNEGSYSMGRTLDVSINGMKMESIYNIPLNSSLIIKIEINDELIDIAGTPMYCTGGGNRYVTGIEFVKMNKNGRKVLQHYVEIFQARKHELLTRNDYPPK